MVCAQTKKNHSKNVLKNNMENVLIYDTATFGTGCFWCTEAIFQSLKGVEKVMPGYAGGQEILSRMLTFHNNC